MRQTDQAQGLRLMKFEEVYGRTTARLSSQAEAVEVLGLPERIRFARVTVPGVTVRPPRVARCAGFGLDLGGFTRQGLGAPHVRG